MFNLFGYNGAALNELSGSILVKAEGAALAYAETTGTCILIAGGISSVTCTATAVTTLDIIPALRNCESSVLGRSSLHDVRLNVARHVNTSVYCRASGYVWNEAEVYAAGIGLGQAFITGLVADEIGGSALEAEALGSVSGTKVQRGGSSVSCSATATNSTYDCDRQAEASVVLYPEVCAEPAVLSDGTLTLDASTSVVGVSSQTNSNVVYSYLASDLTYATATSAGYYFRRKRANANLVGSAAILGTTGNHYRIEGVGVSGTATLSDDDSMFFIREVYSSRISRAIVFANNRATIMNGGSVSASSTVVGDASVKYGVSGQAIGTASHTNDCVRIPTVRVSVFGRGIVSGTPSRLVNSTLATSISNAVISNRMTEIRVQLPTVYGVASCVADPRPFEKAYSDVFGTAVSEGDVAAYFTCLGNVECSANIDGYCAWLTNIECEAFGVASYTAEPRPFEKAYVEAFGVASVLSNNERITLSELDALGVATYSARASRRTLLHSSVVGMAELYAFVSINLTDPAPEKRTVYIPGEYRGVIIPNDNRSVVV